MDLRCVVGFTFIRYANAKQSTQLRPLSGALDYKRRKRVVRNLFKVAGLSVVALLSSCDDDNDKQSQAEFEKNYESWKNTKGKFINL